MSRQKRKPMSDMNVVPYIDVMLVLLIIFMVTAPMLTQGIKIDLPQLENSPVDLNEQDEPLIISVDSNGAYYIETGPDPEKPMELANLSEQAAKIIQQVPNKQVLVRGDKNVTYGTVVDLMAVLQGAGAQGVGLVTEDPDS